MNEDSLKALLASLETTPREFNALLPVLRRLLDLVPIRFYLKDTQHRIVMANKECVRATGHETLEEIFGKTDYDLFTPHHARQAWADEEAILQNPNQPILGKEEPEIWQDGRQIWVKTWKWPWFDEKNERVIGIVGLSAEITGSKDSLDRYQLSAEHAHAGLWHRILSTNEVWFSSRWKAILGYEAHEFPNQYQSLLDSIHPDDVGLVRQTVDDYVQEKTREYHCTFRMRHKDGTWKWIQSQGRISRDGMGREVFAGSHADITDVKEQLLFYEQLIDSVPTFIFVKDDQYRFTFVNKALADAFGVTKDELKNKTDADINHNLAQVQKFREDDRTVLYEKPELDIEEEELYAEKKQVYYFLATKKRRMLSNLDDPATAKPQILGVSTDITSLRAARNLVLEGNQQLEFLMKHAPDGIFIKNRDCKFVKVTENLASLAGHRAADMIGKTDLELFQDADYFNASIAEEREIVATGNSKLNILRLTPTRDGKRYRLISKVPVKDGQGKVIYIMGISKDVHDILTVQTELDLILNTVPQYIFVKHRNGQYVRVNRRFAQRHNETPESIVGKTDFDFWSPELAAQFQQDDRAVMDSRQERLYFQEEQRFKDGTVRILETSKFPLPDAAGRYDLVLGIYDDVTARLDEREMKVHEEVIRSLGHCLKHWMAPLEATMFDLTFEAPSLETSDCYVMLKRQLAIVKESISLATQFASLTSNRQINKQSVNLNELVTDIANVLNFKSRVSVNLHLPATAPYVNGKLGHLRNAIAQLITNAKQALEETSDARIDIRVEESGDDCQIHVIDNGPGIPETVRPVLFELSDIKSSLNPLSTGLGLNYVRTVAEAHDGTVEEISRQQAYPVGSHFVFRLPRTFVPVE